VILSRVQLGFAILVAAVWVGLHVINAVDPTRPVDAGSRFLTHLMHARSIAELFGKVGQHCLHYPLVNGRRRTVIEINSSHYSLVR